MSAGVWYGKRTWLGLGFALVLALALDALGALLLARGMVPMAAARAWTLGSWAAGGFCGTRMAVRAECGSLPVAAAVRDCLGSRARRVADGGLSLGCDGGGVRRAAACGTA